MQNKIEIFNNNNIHRQQFEDMMEEILKNQRISYANLYRNENEIMNGNRIILIKSDGSR